MNPQDHHILSLAYGGGAVQASQHHGQETLARAITAATRCRALAPDVFACHELGTRDRGRRARAGAWIAGAIGVALEQVTVSGDPARRYGYGHREGVLVMITDPETATTWRFIPDLEGYGWLLLDTCPACRAPSVPSAYITNQRDLDGYLGRDRDDTDGTPLETDGDPGHHHTCPYAAPDTP